MNIALVGCGYWGSNYFRILNELGVLSLSTGAPAKLAQACIASYEDILASDADAAVIATPAATHYQIAKELLSAGKHVLVEKPFCTSTRQAAELVKLAARKNRILMSGHQYLFHDAVRKLKSLLSAQQLGTVYHIRLMRTHPGPVRTDVNALWDIAPHDVSILLHLLGRPTAIEASGHSYLQKGVADVASVDFLFKGNVSAHLYASWLDPVRTRTVVVAGSRKTAVFDDILPDGKLVVYDTKAQRRAGAGKKLSLAGTEPLKEQCRHFIDCIVRGRKPLSDGAFGLQVVSILEAADKRMKS